MLLSGKWILLAWIMAVLLIVNSLVILVNIFDYPVTALRHLFSFSSTIGLFAGVLFIIIGILNLISLPKQK